MAENGNGNGNSLLVNIAKYGVGSVIALILVWQLSAELPKLTSRVTSVEAKVDSVIEQHSEMRIVNDTNEKLLRSICLILAESQTEKQLCGQ